jgi:hypothetical protein
MVCPSRPSSSPSTSSIGALPEDDRSEHWGLNGTSSEVARRGQMALTSRMPHPTKVQCAHGPLSYARTRRRSVVAPTRHLPHFNGHLNAPMPHRLRAGGMALTRHHRRRRQ